MADLYFPNYVALVRHEHRHGTDCYVALTDKMGVEELPELTPELAAELFLADFEPDEDEYMEWIGVFPLNTLPVIEEGVKELAELQAEEQRMDEKRGLYPEHEDPTN